MNRRTPEIQFREQILNPVWLSKDFTLPHNEAFLLKHRNNTKEFCFSLIVLVGQKIIHWPWDRKLYSTAYSLYKCLINWSTAFLFMVYRQVKNWYIHYHGIPQLGEFHTFRLRNFGSDRLRCEDISSSKSSSRDGYRIIVAPSTFHTFSFDLPRRRDQKLIKPRIN